MTDTQGPDAGAPVPLSLAGLTDGKMEAQLDKLLHSGALEGKGAEKRVLDYLVRESFAGRVAHLGASAIAKVLFPKEDPSGSRVRKETNKLREHLAIYYVKEAKADDIRFTIPKGQYVVHAPEVSKAVPDWRTGKSGVPPVARILEPVTGAEVHSRVLVRGRIDSLDLDLRAWLVVREPMGLIHPQDRLSRNSPEWQGGCRIGGIEPGASEGDVFEIALVATGDDGDHAFREYLRSDRNGYGMDTLLPADCTVLDVIRVTRRDIRTPR